MKTLGGAPSPIRVKPGLHIVITIPQHACSHVPCSEESFNAVSIPIAYISCEYLRSLQLCEDHEICGKIKRRVCKDVLVIIATHMETRFQRVGD